MYANGAVVRKDIHKALEWYEKAVEAGNADALGAAGQLYFNGVDGSPDYAMAGQYLQQSLISGTDTP
jgi:TPR repeat protein